MKSSQTTHSTQKWSEKADRETAHINKSFGEIVRQLRHKAGMTIEELALSAKVSRAMLSSVERGEKSPTLSVLTGIASGLNVPISRLMAEATPSSVASVVRRPQRLIFRDQETGIERHLLSPSHLDTGIELVEHVLPSGQRFAGTPRIGMRMDKYVVVVEGALTVEMQDASYDLDTADSIYFRINGDYCFVNNSRRLCRYYLFIVHRRE
jgi:transcriptional regulator with XRE-family HTH domain